jgi:hypothetical protein
MFSGKKMLAQFISQKKFQSPDISFRRKTIMTKVIGKQVTETDLHS